MYLVPAEHFEQSRPQTQHLSQPPHKKTHPSIETKRVAKMNVKQHSHDKWVPLRTKMLEADSKETELIRRFADYLLKVLPQSAPQKTTQHHPKIENHPKIDTFGIAETSQRSAIVTQTEPPFVREVSARYETPKCWLSSNGDVDTSDDDVRGFYEVAILYLNKMRFLDKEYGIRRDENTHVIGNSDVIADEMSDISIGEKRFRGTKRLWELLSRKNFNSDVITNSDLKEYKHILELTKSYLVGYESGSDIQILRGSKYTKVISELFPQTTRSRSALGQQRTPRQRWSPYHHIR